MKNIVDYSLLSTRLLLAKLLLPSHLWRRGMGIQNAVVLMSLVCDLFSEQAVCYVFTINPLRANAIAFYLHNRMIFLFCLIMPPYILKVSPKIHDSRRDTNKPSIIRVQTTTPHSHAPPFWHPHIRHHTKKTKPRSLSAALSGRSSFSVHRRHYDTEQ